MSTSKVVCCNSNYRFGWCIQWNWAEVVLKECMSSAGGSELSKADDGMAKADTVRP